MGWNLADSSGIKTKLSETFSWTPSQLPNTIHELLSQPSKATKKTLYQSCPGQPHKVFLTTLPQVNYGQVEPGC